MACSPVSLISSMDRALHPVITNVRIKSQVEPKNFFSFFFNQVSCSIYCENHVHFHLFIHSSKYDSFHLFQFMSTSFIERKISRQTDWVKTVFLAQLSPNFISTNKNIIIKVKDSQRHLSRPCNQLVYKW